MGNQRDPVQGKSETSLDWASWGRAEANGSFATPSVPILELGFKVLSCLVSRAAL